MKKNIKLILFYLLLSNISYGQQRITINRIESRLITNQGIEFIGNLKDKNNDLYTFSNWNNRGMIYLDGKAYSLSNINFNVSTNSFDSRINREKYFSFKSSEIDSVSINNLMFKKMGSSFFEVLFEIGNNSFLKKHDITFKKGVSNRLGVGTLGSTKTLIAYNYLIKSGDVFKKVEFNKRSILELLDNDNDKEALINFVRRRNLSYKKLHDIVVIFKFIFNNLNWIS
ncbi:MAG: hypothetical protein L3J45_01590 [Flavobacteriaceae bacterium]|nr:hypothetical protein [Flavobacteriaceae bacterium]